MNEVWVMTKWNVPMPPDDEERIYQEIGWLLVQHGEAGVHPTAIVAAMRRVLNDAVEALREARVIEHQGDL